MTGTLIFALTLAAALGSALIAGVFFIFSVAVMPALARIAPAAGIAAMQSINVTILNAWFFLAFFGTAAISLFLVVAALAGWTEGRSAYLIAGCLLYVAGSVLVTGAFNVPLNTALGAAGPDSAEGSDLWARYLSTWTVWNHLRAVASLGAAASFILALR